MSDKQNEKETVDVYELGFGAGQPKSLTSEKADVVYDAVHKPRHYQSKSGAFQAYDVIREFELNYCLGNVCKYLLRANKKHEESKEDLLKMIWYTSRELKDQGYEKELKEFFEKQLKEIK